MHVANLFKLNTLVQSVDFETISLPTLKEHYTRVKSLQNNHKLLNSLHDKGEKYKIRLQNIEEIIRKRCNELEKEPKINEVELELNKDKNTNTVDNNNLRELLDKFQQVKLEKNKDFKEETQSSNENGVSTIKDEKTDNDFNFEENSKKIESIAVKKDIKSEPVNYFSRTATTTDKVNDQIRIKQIKKKILNNMASQTKYPKAKSIPLNEAFLLLKEHEKRVQEFQIQQAANKFLEGKSVQYDFAFTQKSNKETLRYRESNNNDDSFSDSDSENEDYFNDDDAEDDGNVPKIDRLHFNQTEKQKFKLNDKDI